eukprot:TRINITY_DN14181_c0_g1_i1.p1 TRINITY_DN14181_c0_g1~~TRINITY_DN14181_c0_g1_i1.p1  ORF type:complete len:117 (+),score=14.86 TRINITY_DN14181_c0_g1_i1:32-352(+)
MNPEVRCNYCGELHQSRTCRGRAAYRREMDNDNEEQITMEQVVESGATRFVTIQSQGATILQFERGRTQMVYPRAVVTIRYDHPNENIPVEHVIDDADPAMRNKVI